MRTLEATTETVDDCLERGASLTWHRHSVLPYASLWITIHRLAYLNQPTIKSFAKQFESGESDWRTDVLRNCDTKRVSVKRIADALQEQYAAFEFCDLQCLAPWLRDAFLPFIRYCPACLAHGYHTILTSLKWLEICPIHSLALADACGCGMRMSTTVSDCLSSPLSCSSCKRRFISPTAARRPSLGRAPITAFDSLVTWLRATSNSVIAPRDFRTGNSHVGAWTKEHARRWSALLGMPVPSAIDSPIKWQERTPLISEDSVVKGYLPIGNPLPRFKNYGRSGPAAIYSAIHRHLRRHVLSRRSKLCQQMFVALSDADLILKEIRRSQDALQAWCMLLWCLHLEVKPSLRLLGVPNRQSIQDERLTYDGALQNRLVGQLTQSDPAAIPNIVDDWVAMHAAGAEMLALWHRLMTLAEEMAETGDVRWGRDLVSLSELHHWVAVKLPIAINDQRHQALFMDVERSPTPALVARARSAKEDRRSCGQARAEIRSLQHAEQCKGYVLRRGQDGVWCVDNATLPRSCLDPTWIKRHRLLGVEGRPRFLLFPTREGWAARAISLPIEAQGTTAASAIDHLRQAAALYVARCRAPEARLLAARPTDSKPLRLMGRLTKEAALTQIYMDMTSEERLIHSILRDSGRDRFWRLDDYLSDMNEVRRKGDQSDRPRRKGTVTGRHKKDRRFP